MIKKEQEHPSLDIVESKGTGLSGKKIVYGFSGLVNGPLSEKQDEAFSKAKKQEFRGMELWL